MQSTRTIFFQRVCPKTSTIVALFLAIGGHALILYFWLPQPEKENHRLSEKILRTSSDFSLIRLNARLKPESFQQTNIDNKQAANARDALKNKLVLTNNKGALPDQAKGNATYYFKSDEVDAKPSIVVDLPSDFLLPANLGIYQRLIMTLRISANGDVDEVEISDELLNKQALQAVIDSFKEMKFEAARIGDNAVASEMRIEALSGFAP